MSTVNPTFRVLVVDNEKIIADSMAMILKVNSYEVEVAYCAEEAIVTAEVFRPHAVISDVIMGVMSGVDLAVYLAKEQPDCKVLLISGQSVAFELLEVAKRQGYDESILSRPVPPENILEFLATCAPFV